MFILISRLGTQCDKRINIVKLTFETWGSGGIPIFGCQNKVEKKSDSVCITISIHNIFSNSCKIQQQIYNSRWDIIKTTFDKKYYLIKIGFLTVIRWYAVMILRS